MEGRNKKKCEKCKQHPALYNGKCIYCGGRNQCTNLENGIRCETPVVNAKKFCTKHGGSNLCKYIDSKGKECKCIAKRAGGFCIKHFDEVCKKKETVEEPKEKKRKTPMSSSSEIITDKEAPIKKQKTESSSSSSKPPNKEEVNEIIYKGEIDADEITLQDTSFTGESKYDSTYKEKEWKQSSLFNFLKGVDFNSDSPKKPSDGKRKSHKKSHKKSRRKSRKKSRRKSRRRNK